LQALRSRDRGSVSSLPASNRACGSLAPGFPRSFIGPLSALPFARDGSTQPLGYYDPLIATGPGSLRLAWQDCSSESGSPYS